MSQQVAEMSNSLLVSGVSAASAQIGVGFMKSLSNATKVNIVISPVSIQVILNMILLGAKLESQTEEELVNFLGYDQLQKSADKNGPHAGMLQVADMLRQSEAAGSGLTFDMANLILTRIQPKSDYTKTVDKFYRNTKWEQFSNVSKEELVKRIDGWIANVTRNEITNLAENLDITPEHLMILTNAAYFRGEWLRPFEVSLTSELPFYNHGLEDQEKKVKFMQQSATFRTIDLAPIAKSETQKREGGLSQAETEYLELTEKLDCRAISLPFSANKGNELDMVIMLPNRRDGLGSMLANLTGSYLKRVLRELDSEPAVKIRVELPKFEFETLFDVGQVMQTAGVKRIFSSTAELDRMFARTLPVKVDQILHKAKVTVDEKGAVAAAATVATVMLRSSQHWLPVRPFRADHPFLFVIRHKPSGMPTFLGSVVGF